MLKPFVKCYRVFDVNTNQYKLYNSIEKIGFKRNDYGLEATIQSSDILMISFRSTRSELFNSTVYLNPVLLAEYAKLTDQSTKISIRIQSSTCVLILAVACVCGLVYNIFTGLFDNALEIFICCGFLIALAIADIYMRATLFSRFQKWMTKAAAFSV